MIDIEILKKQNSLTTNEEGLIYVKPLGEGNWQTYPLENFDGCLLLTPDDYVLLKANYYQIKDDLSGLEIVEPVEPEFTLEELIEKHKAKIGENEENDLENCEN